MIYDFPRLPADTLWDRNGVQWEPCDSTGERFESVEGVMLSARDLICAHSPLSDTEKCPYVTDPGPGLREMQCVLFYGHQGQHSTGSLVWRLASVDQEERS